MSQQQYDNRNKWYLFRNDKEGGNPNWPDYRGSLNIDGKEYFIDGWVRESKKDGKKFISGTVKPKLARDQGASQNPPAQTAAPKPDADFDDSIPF